MKKIKYSLILSFFFFLTFFSYFFISFFFFNKEEKINNIKTKISIISIKKEYFFSDFNWLVEYYSKKYNVNKNLILAISEVETRKRNLIGDKHLKNKAYGYFQLRQPAINQVNKIYKINKVKNASELLNSIDLQIEYATLFLKYLFSVTNNDVEAISAYNIGLSNVKKGKIGNYYNKILNEINKMEELK